MITLGEVYKYEFSFTQEQVIAFAEVTGDKKTANDILKSSYSIPGIKNSRQIIKWAFNASINDVSDVFECEDKFVVATISNKKGKGLASLESVENVVKAAIVKRKKGEILSQKFNETNSLTSLNELAQKLRLQVQDAQGVNFTSMSIPGIGSEPRVVGIVSTLENGKVSPVIIGENGVYVLTVSNISETGNNNTENEKMQLTRSIQSKFEREIAVSLKEISDIEDNRIIFE